MDVKTEINLQGRNKIALVGNPNVGKSVIFGLITGQYVTVSNYPGTTVEVTRSIAVFDKNTTIIDTPGINSLVPNSEDEKVTRDILIKEDTNYIIQVADAKNLLRTLFLTLQIADLGIPYCLVLNMSDETESRGIKINHERLSQILNVPVIPTVAIQRQGINEIIRCIKSIMVKGKVAAEKEVLSAKGTFLSQDTPNHTINQARLRRAQEIVNEVQTSETATRTTLRDFLERITMHPVWGIPILLFILFLLYEFVGVFGAGTLVGFLEDVVFGQYINPFADSISQRYIPVNWLRDFFTGEYGLITMALSYGFAIILPIVATFFLVFGILEDTGYLPRLAVMVNRVFRLIGLNGKAVLPLMLGSGCGTMATMVTRILPTKKERILATLLLALGVPCSAQLGVILGLLSGISFVATFWWLGSLLVIMFIVAYSANKVLAGVCSDFIMEIPPIRKPEIGNILAKTFARVRWYLKEVIPIFIVGTAVLFIIDKLGVLSHIKNLFSPVIRGMLGLPEEVTSVFLIGFFRRDYGAAGLYDLAKEGLLSQQQIVVALITITLFVPCFAQFLMMVKERGWKTALLIVAFIFPLAIMVGGLVNLILNLLGGI
ncbi:MAG: ferrous iron transporter B [Planctomycetota bacterium]|nr:ferrous iron transporter B [Planctomycetota bacterium]MDI6787258.1 ferrous iron transporter B [Planctomycetota bacterium]